jgi:hypothetical protein
MDDGQVTETRLTWTISDHERPPRLFGLGSSEIELWKYWNMLLLAKLPRSTPTMNSTPALPTETETIALSISYLRGSEVGRVARAFNKVMVDICLMFLGERLALLHANFGLVKTSGDHSAPPSTSAAPWPRLDHLSLQDKLD